MGTDDDAPASKGDRETAEEGADGERIGARHGQLADSGVNTGPVGT